MTADAEFVAALLRRRAEDYLAALTETELAERIEQAATTELADAEDAETTNPREENHD